MIHSLGICFANNPSVCKSQRKQMPGSCSLRAHNRLKENVQLETAAVCGHRPLRKLGTGRRGAAFLGHACVSQGCGRHVLGNFCQPSLPQRGTAIPPKDSLLPRPRACNYQGHHKKVMAQWWDWREVTRLTVLVLNHSSAKPERNPVNVQEECERNRRLVFICMNLL